MCAYSLFDLVCVCIWLGWVLYQYGNVTTLHHMFKCCKVRPHPCIERQQVITEVTRVQTNLILQ